MTSNAVPASSLIVIPCLNEAAHIGALLEQLRPAAQRLGALIVVADGGSADGTLGIVEGITRHDARVVLMHNPKRIQSAAINLAVASHGDGARYLIRIDAHGGYPDDYCDRLVEEASATGADSVVVSMLTSGTGAVQKAVAAAQNSKLGTGGSKHRHQSAGEWVDHGHHALMRIAAFSAVGGYDETFSHNEDAELDYRLRQAGHRIWMSGRTHMIYYPRSSLKSLYFQYLGYGRGRARNVLKHRMVPKLRQMIPLLVFPVVLLAAFSFVHWLAAVPFMVWAAVCLGYGLATAIRQRNPGLTLVGVSAMVMHFGWSVGFWLQLLGRRSQRGVA
ncbi:glycosyltransferase family 2 protein [Mesorhizobium sp. M4B.F.Ca.ET.215.01.1.1]|uniref:glycosyltransferase family 2 protein n=1 Tax=unclassified Mesorhizobium TaxID=325217 RepID=UPI000FCAC7A6|nr:MULTISPECIES: glycosyltransferase family 2 protein [unclassified Mesorhizobium]RUW20441.1 glycosyltransferase family 2 protein [Mesorhizobium sp. M4B.F.Ca.ET.013.02.1.1]RVD45265.1 glycosyltransferase family 2 protein [Mesorhizobium sp. M4B.F.Ca.ET.019.03.1.1]TGQ15392.1 glycosyltransferase family 2 protein [Mesorhizobium sp. M4B.F.Ca.ET.215.01.1.1]TGQ48399.1 glycosyltransferase family 2 protein [Mesorhizobium sp. M00.F.Ca.ET.220.01.1.1]TGR11456.1 glycosyltransferase family 2 protein [Mesorhi